MSETVQTDRQEIIEGAEISADTTDYLGSLQPSPSQESPIISDQQPNNTNNVFQLRTPESVKAYAEAVSGSVDYMRRRVLDNAA